MFRLAGSAGAGLEETQRVRGITGRRERQNWKKTGGTEKRRKKESKLPFVSAWSVLRVILKEIKLD